ncbi:Na/Pi cotransporter family protein [bacterium]|nr:Na/Pi cotransporter family protein [bacterium]
MNKELIFGIVGGLGLFIYGIHIMGEGLHKAAGDKMRKILGALTGTPVRGVLVGIGVTSIIQSSSATTVMLVGFVNAGLMTLMQAMGVILGADIGTTITAQLIAFKLTDYALLFIGLGMAVSLIAKKKTYKYFGEFLIGFGILFLGLKIMTSVVKPLGASETVRNAFIMFSKKPFLGVITGMVVTMIVQSSSVTVGIVLALASTGLLDLRGAIPIILGENIGTCVTALLASIGTTISAKRTAVAHITFKVLGTVIILSVLPFYRNFIQITSSSIMRQCANAHTIFNVLLTISFLPFVKPLANLIKKFVPGEEVIVDKGPKHLEKRLLKTPVLAIQTAKEEVINTLNLVKEMIGDAMRGFMNEDKKALVKVTHGEEAVDSLRLAVTGYLMELMQGELSEEESRKIPALLHVINDIERMGDHAENLKDLAELKIEKKMPFSSMAIEELQKIYNEVDQMSQDAINALQTNDITQAKQVVVREEKINSLRNELKENHIKRLEEGICKVLSGVVFLDMISNFEKIADHLNNVGQAVMYPLQWKHSRKSKKLA